MGDASVHREPGAGGSAQTKGKYTFEKPSGMADNPGLRSYRPRMSMWASEVTPEPRKPSLSSNRLRVPVPPVPRVLLRDTPGCRYFCLERVGRCACRVRIMRTHAANACAPRAKSKNLHFSLHLKRCVTSRKDVKMCGLSSESNRETKMCVWF